MTRDPHDDLTGRLPLSERDFHILFALVDGPCHGYGLVKTIRERTGGALSLDPANLYHAVQRMMDQGLVEDADRREAPDSARIRRYYRIAPRGRRVLAADAERMRVLVAAACTKKLIPPSRSEI